MRTRSFATAGLRRPALALSLAAAIVLVAALASVSAQATTPGKNGLIAFHRAYGRSGVTAAIFVMNPDGTAQRQLTHPKFHGVDEIPDFAPDGSNILFTRYDRHFIGSIWRVNLSGGGLRRVDPRCPAGGCQNEGTGGAAYSPNGKLIAFSRIWGPTPANLHGHGPPKFNALYVMSANGKNLKRLLRLNLSSSTISNPQWSPDGARIVFVRTNSKQRHALFVVNANGTGMREITPLALNGGDRPDWSPDGTLILFRSVSKSGDGGDYYTVRPDGSGLHQLTQFGSKATVASARYSPDGQAIVFGYEPNGGEADIYTMKVDGTGLTQLTHDPGWESTPDWGPAP